MHFVSFSHLSSGIFLVFSIVHKKKRLILQNTKRLKAVTHLHNLVQIGHLLLQVQENNLCTSVLPPSFILLSWIKDISTPLIFNLPPAQSSGAHLISFHPFARCFIIFSFYLSFFLYAHHLWKPLLLSSSAVKCLHLGNPSNLSTWSKINWV